MRSLYVVPVCISRPRRQDAALLVRTDKEERTAMLLEDDIRLVAGLHGWKVALHRLHPENPVYSVIIYWRRRRHCLGLLSELQRLSIEDLTVLILSSTQRQE